MITETRKLYLDACLRPNRSLSPKAYLLVMLLIISISFIAGILFVSMGAFPVLGFFGLDALLIWLAFRSNFRALKQETHVRVSAETIDLSHHRPGQKSVHVVLPTCFTRLELSQAPRRPSELRLSYRDQSWVIGRFLTPSERRDFRQALESAILQARQERHPV